MDKATYTFNKYAGVWGSITQGVKGFLSRSGKYLKKSTKLEPKPLTNTMKPIKDTRSFETVRGKVDTATSQRMLETQVNKSTWTGGKRPVSILNRDELLQRLAVEKEHRKLFGA